MSFNLLELSSDPLTTVLLIVLATFILEDVAIISTGVLIAENQIGLALGFFALLLGLIVGDFGLYLLGRSRFAQWSIKYLSIENKVRSIQQTLHKRLWRILLLARCIPGLRLPAFFTSGLVKVNCLKFFLIVSTLAFVWIAAVLPFSILLQQQAQSYLGPLRFLGIALVLLCWMAISWRARKARKIEGSTFKEKIGTSDPK